MSDTNLPPAPEVGEFQTAFWREDIGAWWIRDLTPEELAAKFPPPEPGPVTLDDYRAAIEAHVDATARARDYGSAVSCASYVASMNPVWQAEALAFVHWRDAVWVHVYAEFAKVMAEEREQPDIPDLIAELPAMVWPE